MRFHLKNNLTKENLLLATAENKQFRRLKTNSAIPTGTKKSRKSLKNKRIQIDFIIA
jgi:hypothetical protein